MEPRLGVPVSEVAPDICVQTADPSLAAVQSNTWRQEILIGKSDCGWFSAQLMSVQTPPSLQRAACVSCSHPPGDLRLVTSPVGLSCPSWTFSFARGMHNICFSRAFEFSFWQQSTPLAVPPCALRVCYVLVATAAIFQEYWESLAKNDNIC